MADIIIWKPNDFRRTLYSRPFGVTDYEFNMGFPFFEMVDPIWRILNFGNYDFRTTLNLPMWSTKWAFQKILILMKNSLY